MGVPDRRAPLFAAHERRKTVGSVLIAEALLVWLRALRARAQLSPTPE